MADDSRQRKSTGLVGAASVSSGSASVRSACSTSWYHDRAADAEPLFAEAQAIFERLETRPWLERAAQVVLEPVDVSTVSGRMGTDRVVSKSDRLWHLLTGFLPLPFVASRVPSLGKTRLAGTSP